MSTSLNLRKAALTLHSLNPTDKKWILDRVPESQQELLEPLLDELKQIGLTQSIPFDLDFDLSQEFAEKSASQKSTLTADDLKKEIDGLPIVAIKAALNGESLVIVARLLRIKDWRWSDAYINSLTPLEKRQLERLIYAQNKQENRLDLNQFDRHLCHLFLARSRAMNTVAIKSSPTFIQRVFQGFTK